MPQKPASVTRLPTPRRPPPRVSQLAVDASTRVGRARRVEQPFDPLRAPLHPPGVVPTGDAAPLAQDDSTFVAVAGWAQSAISSALAEGTTFLGYSNLSLMAQRAEYRVISEEIASEMTREWIEFKSVGDEDKSERIAELEEEMARLDVKGAFRKAAEHDGFFGRGHLYLDTGDTDDRDELRLPIGDGWNLLSRAKVGPAGKAGREHDKKLRAVRPVEPVWSYPTQYDSNDPLKGDWYKPTTWHVMGKEVHASRFLTFVGREVPDLLKPAYSFGGLSMSQMAKPYVDNWLRTRQAVSDVVNNFSKITLTTTGVAASLMAGGDELFKRVEVATNVSTNTGVFLLGSDEELSNVTTPLGGLEQLQAQAQEHMAAVSRIPIVKLLGIQPAGLNASSEGEIRSFYDWIKAFQEQLFRKHLRTVIGFVMLSLWGEVDRDIDFDFKDLWQLDESARTALEKTKTDIDDANVAMGAIAPEEVRRRLATDRDSQYAGLDLDPDALPEPTGGEGLLPGPEEEGEPPMGPGGPPKTAGRVHDPRDRSENITARAGNLPSPTGGFGDDKLTKAEVDFEHPAKEPHHCDECEHFRSPAACELVEGAIDPADWCRLFEKKTLTANDVDFEESKHPRGQPGNAGQFASSSGGSKSRGEKAAETRKKNQETAKRAAETESSRQEARQKVNQIVNEAAGYDLNDLSKRPNAPRPLTHVETLRIAHIVADHLGFEKKLMAKGQRAGLPNIRVTDEKRTFELNGQNMDYAGSANLETGEITLYSSALEPHTVANVMAHEVMHQKFETVWRAYRAERQKILEDERDILRPDDSIREEFKEEFPTYVRFSGLFEVRKLADDDGITDYSREWWNAWSKGGVDSLNPVHETLAEMSRLDWEGSLPRLLWFKESKTWKPLYEAVNELYPKVSKS